MSNDKALTKVNKLIGEKQIFLSLLPKKERENFLR